MHNRRPPKPIVWTHPMAMRPTGWFQIGWSGEYPKGAVKPLRYFGEDLVAFRTESGELSVIEGHCPHLGAHLGHGGKVIGDCIACPYHGWQWNGDGKNPLIPYQDKPITKKLKTWHIREQHELVFMWHDPKGGAPRWEIPDIFGYLPERPRTAADFYPAWPHGASVWPDEPICPQQGIENGPDTMHFRYAHNAPEDPVMLSFKTTDTTWDNIIGFKSPKTGEVAMTLRASHPGVSMAFAEFDGRNGYRLVLAHTPVDEYGSDIRVSYWFSRRDGDTSEQMPEDLQEMAKQIFDLTEEDLIIWRNQKFVPKPVFAQQDVEAYSSFRRHCLRFYEDDVPAVSKTSA